MCVNEIILVSEKLSQNGADRVLTELANQWTKCGKKVTLIQLLREDSSVDEGTFILLPAVSVKKIITNTRSKSGFYIKSVQAVSHILRQKRNAVVISFLSKSIYVSAVCSLIPPSPAVGMCSFSQRETIRQDGPISVLRVYYAIYPFVVLISAFFKREKQKDIFSKGFKEKELLYQIQLIPSCPKDLLEPGEKRIVQPVGL